MWPSTNSGTPPGVMRAISSNAVSTGVPSSGTVADNGALTLTTAMARTYSEGIYLYFPAGALFAGAVAGLYWTVMSSTTAGIVYNNTYTSGDPVIPASPTPIVATGPGAYVQVTTEVILRQTTLTAGTLGAYGSLRVTAKFTYTNSAGSKSLNLKLGGTTLFNRSRTTTASDTLYLHLMNRGRVDRQLEVTSAQAAGTPFSAGTTSGATFHSINLSVDQIFSHTVQLAVAADYAISDGAYLEIQQ